jgi:hypothetical protein
MNKWENVAEVIDYLEFLTIEDDYDFKDYDSIYWDKIPGASRVEEEGGEGEGDYFHVVISLEREGYEKIYLKYQAHYDSWNGADFSCFDNPSLCRPEKVEITVYTNYE